MQGHKRKKHIWSRTVIILHPWVHFMGWKRHKYEGFVTLKVNDSSPPDPVQAACFSVYVRTSCVYKDEMFCRTRRGRDSPAPKDSVLKLIKSTFDVPFTFKVGHLSEQL